MSTNKFQQTPTPPDNPKKNSSRATSAMPSREEKFLQQAEQVIRENLDNPQFTVPHLALALDLSVSQLNRRLNSLLDRSAGQLIREQRLTYAAECLSRNVSSIKNIARMTGYRDQAHFCRSFKKRYGCAPSDYGEREQ